MSDLDQVSGAGVEPGGARSSGDNMRPVTPLSMIFVKGAVPGVSFGYALRAPLLPLVVLGTAREDPEVVIPGRRDAPDPSDQ